jgi:glycosyltransferase involved in cell wall biosynthesis
MASAPTKELSVPDLPGAPGSRIVCVANLRKEKDHLTLVRAMTLVVQKYPTAHLLLVGAYSDSTCSAGSSYFEVVKREVARNSLSGNITFLGQRRDIPAILNGSDIGVLSSKTEGLPVSLLEYGAAGLPVVATRVGDCEEVLDSGRAGLLVPPQSPSELAEALLSLFGSPELRAEFGKRFLRRVQELYSAKSIIKQVCSVYQHALQLEKTELARGESAQYGFRA